MKIKVQINRQENANYYNCKIGNIIEVNFEEYVAAVVASEIGNSNIEACKAQAIAARTYAISQGVLSGKPISDLSSTAQAYRAPRYNIQQYKNAIDATNSTKGQILTYNDKPITAVYSHCNGGKIISAAQKWGGNYPYLVSKFDWWDAASGVQKNGHGVGMSQSGAIYASSIGVGYEEILNFYYPGTVIEENYGLAANATQILNELKTTLQSARELLNKIKEE